MRELALTVNGRRVHEHVDDRLLLSDFLRHALGLRGTHVGCEHGVCGACTVQLDGRAVRSLPDARRAGRGPPRRDGRGRSPTPTGPLSALQDAFRRHHALQCGFCTPGILMSAAELLAEGGGADAARDRGAALGPPLPLHRLRADRGRHRRGRGYAGVNLGEHLLACAERHPDALAIVDGEQRATYAELLARARAAAGGLAALGVAPGDRVAAALKNRIETAVLYWGAQWLGAVFVPLNWRLRPDELTYCVGDCGARVLAIEGASAEAAEAVPGTPLIAIADAPAGAPLAAAEGPASPSSADQREPALMLYTSGTTGRPKGVPRSHRAERAAALAQLVQLQLRPGDRTLGVMPLYHTMGMRSLLAASACGGVFCSQPEFRPEAALDAVERERLTSLYLAPTLFHDMVAAQRERPRDLASVRALAYAGAPMTGVLVERCIEAFAPEAFVNHYGSTEIYTFTIHSDQRAKPGCAGRAGLNARIRLVDPVAGRLARGGRRPRRGRAGGLRARERRGVRGLLAAARRRRAAAPRRLVLPRRSRPARRGRRPLPRRPDRRHDRLGRRERASARDRGVARAPSGRRRGRRGR